MSLWDKNAVEVPLADEIYNSLLEHINRDASDQFYSYAMPLNTGYALSPLTQHRDVVNSLGVDFSTMEENIGNLFICYILCKSPHLPPFIPPF